MKFVSFVLILNTVFLSGCIFTTREPEQPDTRRSSFQPPTSAQIVVANIQNALREKNAENYIQCLLGGDASTMLAGRQYVFEPSAEAAARFASVFAFWGSSRERQAFLTMTARIPSTTAPVVSFTNDRFEVLMPDSAVYIADYTLKTNTMLAGVQTDFSGKLRFTISALPNGFWAISRWSDQQNVSAQQTTASWSIFKAQFAN